MVAQSTVSPPMVFSRYYLTYRKHLAANSYSIKWYKTDPIPQKGNTRSGLFASNLPIKTLLL